MAKFVSALIVPSFEQLEIYCQKHGIPLYFKEEIIKHPDIQKLYRERIEDRTKCLGQVEKVKKFVLLPQEFFTMKQESLLNQ
jgi:long-chain acyl-CoA synthetase